MSRALLVVGGTGFIGAAVSRAAQAAGWAVAVTGHDAETAGDAAAGLPGTPGARRVALDVTDPDAVGAVFDDVRPDAVVHLAAYGAGDAGLAAGATQNPARAVDVNVRGLAHVIEAAADRGIRRICWSSSSTVYGPDGGRGLVDEDAATHPDSVYGATKVGAEQLARVLRAQRDLCVVGIRLPLVYGPGRWYGGSQESLVRFVGDLAAGRDARIDAWTGAADWIHVDDAAASLLAGVTVEPGRELYNVVGHRGSLADLARALIAAASAGTTAGITAQVTDVTDGAPDLPAMDDRRIRDELGFRPRFADAAAGAAGYLAPARPDTEEAP
ncbi:NAD-dependent epimerase/dehydratase family protein [Jiangella gansuensis]|uniref:NAD-dependent epimerase/dehydratase family protein n=1 Tax=Jiangella gansuensis TaxID=281473 RepID=UPI00047AEB99|nr:NAD(P)-dependent oxidoreductase [Jiangella gansuensis]